MVTFEVSCRCLSPQEKRIIICCHCNEKFLWYRERRMGRGGGGGGRILVHLGQNLKFLQH